MSALWIKEPLSPLALSCHSVVPLPRLVLDVDDPLPLPELLPPHPELLASPPPSIFFYYISTII